MASYETTTGPALDSAMASLQSARTHEAFDEQQQAALSGHSVPSTRAQQLRSCTSEKELAAAIASLPPKTTCAWEDDDEMLLNSLPEFAAVPPREPRPTRHASAARLRALAMREALQSFDTSKLQRLRLGTSIPLSTTTTTSI